LLGHTVFVVSETLLRQTVVSHILVTVQFLYVVFLPCNASWLVVIMLVLFACSLLPAVNVFCTY